MISTKGRYGLRVMIDLARHTGEGYIPLKEIAEHQSISKKYLESIIKSLLEAGLVTSLGGKSGGYMLARTPDRCTVGEILECMEGTLAPVACLKTDAEACPRQGRCDTLPLWQEFDSLVHDFFFSKTLADLL